MADTLHVVFYVREHEGKLLASGKFYPTKGEALMAFAETPCIWSDTYEFDTQEEAQSALEDLQEECNNPTEFYKKYGDFM